MLKLSDLLERVKRLGADEIHFYAAVKEVCKEKLSLSVNDSDIKFRSGVLEIHCASPATKSEAFIKNRDIIEVVNSRQSVHKVSTIHWW